MRNKLKVLTVVGTRPELIRLSVTIELLDRFTDHYLVHTGQNYDYELNQVFFDEMGIRKPDEFLHSDVSTLGKAVASIIAKSEEVLLRVRPEAVLVLGDTNSSMFVYMAKRMKIPIYHLEAGNRCFDLNTPEEINRKIIDHISDFNLVYTEHGRRNLLSEGIPSRRIYLSGSPMKEVIDRNIAKVNKSAILDTLEIRIGEYYLASFHREENVDNSANLRGITGFINALEKETGKQVIVSLHPRTAKRIDQLGAPLNHGVRLHKAFGFFDYLKLQMSSICVLSDSGTISEEAAILGFPAITIRNAMERPEALDTANIMISGLTTDSVINAVDAAVALANRERQAPSEYLVSDFSVRVVKLILGTATLSNRWNGIIENQLTFHKR